jgi:hypothetical protein
MGAPVITSQTTVMCGHGGSATHVPTNLRVRVGGAPVAVASDQHVVAGCALTSVPSTPCTTLTWSVPALRVRAGGVPVLVQSSVPMGIGPGVVVAGQFRVMAT